MPATTDFLGRETPLESVRPRRFNPATARARGQANTGGTSWPRVRCAAPRKRRSRRRSGTRRKKAVPPSRRSRWPGSRPNRARPPSARRASRTTHRWREGGTAFFLLVPLRLRLLLFLGAAHLTLGHDVPPVLACPRARAVAGLKRRGRTNSSGVSRPRKSVVAGILCCLLPLGGRNRRPQLFDYILCLTTYRVCASETASLAHRGASPETS